MTADSRWRNRVHQGLLIVSLLACCWLGMMILHELGHIVAARVTGGQVTQVVLHPLAISRTDVSPNPRPAMVVWAGPLAGVGLPVLLWCGWRSARLPGAHLWRFFAGFCLIANGAYIGGGSLERIGDAGEMLRHGSPVWLLWLFALVCVPSGLFLWHRQAEHFGLGQRSAKVDPRTAYALLALLALIVAIEFACSERG